MWHGEFRDPRFVQVYDAEFVWSQDDDFFLWVVNETPQARVVDLGCGTGRLTLGLVAAGHRVTGVDPAPASLEAARRKPRAEQVRWIAGASESVPAAAFDVALMTSHVAQFLVEDVDWLATLADLHEALVSGGRLVFDTRDPQDRRWEQWNPTDSRRTVQLPDGDTAELWTEVTRVDGDVVSLTHHCVLDGGAELLSTATMRFRSEQAIRDALSSSGFTVENIYGGWQREPVGEGDGELLVLARRR